jgi:hypothetical protein
VVVRADLETMLCAAHAHTATVNDVVLTAVGGALHRLLDGRGEQVDRFVVSVPVSARQATTVGELGNQVGVVPVGVPGVGDPSDRLADVAAQTRRAKDVARGSSTALIGPLFRLLAALRVFRWFVERQRLVHTFVTNLRGPEVRLAFLGAPVLDVIALTSTPGNVTVSFAVLSYCGELTVTLVADPDLCPDLGVLQQALADELTTLGA